MVSLIYFSYFWYFLVRNIQLSKTLLKWTSNFWRLKVIEKTQQFPYLYHSGMIILSIKNKIAHKMNI